MFLDYLPWTKYQVKVTRKHEMQLLGSTAGLAIDHFDILTTHTMVS